MYGIKHGGIDREAGALTTAPSLFLNILQGVSYAKPFTIVRGLASVLESVFGVPLAFQLINLPSGC